MPSFLLNLGGPNASGIFARAIPDFDPIVLWQFFPLRLIGRDLKGAAVIQQPNFYKPLFVL